METIRFSILINSDKQNVWHTMLDDKTYREWTKEFHVGSFYEGNWEKGSEIRFLAANEEGKLEGMLSKIKENIPYQFISIEHLGMISNGVIDTTSDEVQKWAHCLENYSFFEKGNMTELIVEMEVDPNYKSMFDEMWPRALNTLKKICEK